MTTLILEQAREEMRRRLLAGETLEMLVAEGGRYTYGPRHVLHEAVDLIADHAQALDLMRRDVPSDQMTRAIKAAINETVRDGLFDWLRAMDKKGE